MILAHEEQILEYEKTLAQVKQHKGLWSEEEVAKLEKKLKLLKQKIYAQLKPIDRVAICRHPARPQTLDYIQNLCNEFVELFGDRTLADDKALILGLGNIQGEKFVILGQQKGKDTESRIHHNFGMLHPEGYRKALRGMQLAAKFGLPVVSFIDTPGAYPGLAAEERGQGWAIAKNLAEMSHIPTPILIVFIGEGCSGGALGIGIGDKIGMLEHAYYSVISPEGCASILWKDTQKSDQACSALKMQAEDLLKLKVIDTILQEPLGGAHQAPEEVYKKVQRFILDSYEELKNLPVSDLLEKRYEKFRSLGSYTTILASHETSTESCDKK